MASPSASGDTASSGRYRVVPYGGSRHWAVYEDDTLVAVTVYKRGAANVRRMLEEKDTLIAEQGAEIERLQAAQAAQAGLSALHGSTTPPQRFQDRISPRRGSAPGRA